MSDSESLQLPSTGYQIPPDLRHLLGKPPLVTDEDPAHYEDLLTNTFAQLQVRNIVEGFLARDYVDISWEIMRCRGYSAIYLIYNQEQALAELLAGVSTEPDKEKRNRDARKLARAVSMGDGKAIKLAKDSLAKDGLWDQNPTALTFIRTLTTMETSTRMIGVLEVRRANVIRELEYLRSASQQGSSAPIAGMLPGEWKDAGPTLQP